MAAPHRLSIHIGDYLKNTPPVNAASWEHHGIYFAALMSAWNVPGCRLPVDKLWMALKFGCSVEVYEEKVEPIIAIYFKKRGNFWYQKRLSKEYDFSRKSSKKQSERAKSRWDKEKDVSRGNAEPMPDLSRGNAPPAPSSSTGKKEIHGREKLTVLGGSGKGAQPVTIKDPKERLNRFQAKLAQELGRDGFKIVASANDPACEFHARSVLLCKEAARRLNKRWPTQWPV